MYMTLGPQSAQLSKVRKSVLAKAQIMEQFLSAKKFLYVSYRFRFDDASILDVFFDSPLLECVYAYVLPLFWATDDGGRERDQ